MAKATDRVRKSSGKAAADKAGQEAAVRVRAAREPEPQEHALAPPKIVIFSCQWAPHYAFQSLYRRGRRAEGDGVRVLTACIGRVGEDIVLEAFRQGADGVAVFSCPPEICRHGLDHGKFQARLASLRTILAALGIPPATLLVAAFHPHEGERLAEEIASFAAHVAAASAADRIPAAHREHAR